MPQPQAVEQAPQDVGVEDRIGNLANSFLEGLETDQDPDRIAPAEQPEPEPEDATEDEGEAEAETPPPEAGLEEVEFEGKQYSVPKEIKNALLRQDDYTRKTQDIAATRKNFEVITRQAQELTQRAQQLAPLNAQLFAMQSQAKQLREQLTPNLRQDDPITYNTIQGELGLLTQDIQQFHGQLTYAQQEQANQLQEVRRKQLMADLPMLVKAVPDIAKKEVQDALANYAIDNGLPDEALDYMRFSAPAVKILWQSQQYEKMVANQVKSKAAIQEKVKSLPAVKPGRSQQAAPIKDLQAAWKKDGGKMSSPAFDALLAARLKR